MLNAKHIVEDGNYSHLAEPATITKESITVKDANGVEHQQEQHILHAAIVLHPRAVGYDENPTEVHLGGVHLGLAADPESIAKATLERHEANKAWALARSKKIKQPVPLAQPHPLTGAIQYVGSSDPKDEDYFGPPVEDTSPPVGSSSESLALRQRKRYGNAVSEEPAV